MDVYGSSNHFLKNKFRSKTLTCSFSSIFHSGKLFAGLEKHIFKMITLIIIDTNLQIKTQSFIRAFVHNVRVLLTWVFFLLYLYTQWCFVRYYCWPQSVNSEVVLSLSGSVSPLSETDVLRRFPSTICRKQWCF